MNTRTSRPNDVLYDPLFMVSGEKIIIKQLWWQSFQRQHFPIANAAEEMISTLNISTPILTLAGPTRSKKSNKKIQTQYRESSAQTSPWQPPCTVMEQGNLEILKLDFLKWGSGLPAGMHEVRLIERARMKRAWEKNLPPATDIASLEKRRCVIEAMEHEEWAFREQEIQDIQNLRLQLLEQMLVELHEKSRSRTEQKLRSYCNTKLAEKKDKLKKLYHQSRRELRKLEMKQHGINSRYKAINIIEQHTNKTSELYAPKVRHGDDPKYWHAFIDQPVEKYRAEFLGVERFNTLPRSIGKAIRTESDSLIKLPGTRLCIRETKWSTPVLKQLHAELKSLSHKSYRRQCTLLEKLEKEASDICTPDFEGGDDWDEDIHQATVLIQSILRGRASQVLIFDGRNRCRELIRELRSTRALQEEDQIKKFNEHLEVISQQREHEICLNNTNQLHEILNQLSGSVVGTLIDFLNKELRRLLDERKAHAMCLVAERERNNREAAEAGRRQTEIRRRKEHDEIFKQVMKVHQDTVDLYLEDIITEGIEFTSEDEAHIYVKELAKRVDDEAYKSSHNNNNLEKEEIVANLVHNFLLPNVEKELVRDNIKKKQKVYLKAAHNSIYNKFECLPKPSSKCRPSRNLQSVDKSKVQSDNDSQDITLIDTSGNYDKLGTSSTAIQPPSMSKFGKQEQNENISSTALETNNEKLVDYQQLLVESQDTETSQSWSTNDDSQNETK